MHDLSNKKAHRCGNADQLRSLETNSLIFSNSWQSLTVLN